MATLRKCGLRWTRNVSLRAAFRLVGVAVEVSFRTGGVASAPSLEPRTRVNERQLFFREEPQTAQRRIHREEMAWMLMGKLLLEQSGPHRLHLFSRKPARSSANFFQENHKGHKETFGQTPPGPFLSSQGVFFFVFFVSFVVQIPLAARRRRV
jgi:hypothetical protein